jgi:hypothetical protein
MQRKSGQAEKLFEQLTSISWREALVMCSVFGWKLLSLAEG